MFTTEVYDGLVDSPGSWSKRGVSKNHLAPPLPHHHHLHHLTVPRPTPVDKKETTQLSPVKKRVKEGTPPSGISIIISNFKFIKHYVFISKKIDCMIKVQVDTISYLIF